MPKMRQHLLFTDVIIMEKYFADSEAMEIKVPEVRMEEVKSEKPKKEANKPDYYALRFRSTGLGKTMLQGELADIVVVDDMLVVHIQSTTPVRWRIRAALTFRGLLQVIKMALKTSIIKFVLFGFRTLKNPKLPDDF